MKISEILKSKVNLFVVISDSPDNIYHNDYSSIYLAFPEVEITNEKDVLKYRKRYFGDIGKIGQIIAVGDDFVEINFFTIKRGIKKSLHLGYLGVRSAIFNLSDITILNLIEKYK